MIFAHPCVNCALQQQEINSVIVQDKISNNSPRLEYYMGAQTYLPGVENSLVENFSGVSSCLDAAQGFFFSLSLVFFPNTLFLL